MFLFGFCAGVLTLFMLESAHGRSPPVCSSRQLFKGISKCDKLWGFDLRVFQRNDVGFVIDLDQLIRYCKNPERPDIVDCIQNVQGSCKANWKADFTNRANQNSKDSFDYLCSRIDIIETNRDCVFDQLWPITACYRTAGEDHVQAARKNSGNRGRGQKWAGKNVNILKLGEEIELCVSNILKENCDHDVAKVFANFIYGTMVSPFKDRQ